MKALLIIWIFNAAERALDMEPMPDLAACEIVLTEALERMEEYKRIGGMNKGVGGICVEVPTNE